MGNEVQPDLSLDCLGLYCPQPLLQTRERLEELEPGQSLEVFADDPASEEDIKRLIKRLGHELVNFERRGDINHFIIKKGGLNS
ncbi:MAG: sulfurtransferase TusA family protein [Peptococcaceae bacterium]|jgi:TusA-related sulfurtransferase|nr:sulfurtransferase TusA family protein [Peptococcaceae bacterium]